MLTYDPQTKTAMHKEICTMMRHNTSKDLYEIETDGGNKVVVTADHSMMVMRNGELVECKPTELKSNDKVVICNVGTSTG